MSRALTRYSASGLRKVLARLAVQGIVLATRAGPAVLYRLNHDHLAVEHIVAIARLRDTFLRRLADRLDSWEIRPESAAVFGSASRGEMTAESDVDLLLARQLRKDRDADQSV